MEWSRIFKHEFNDCESKQKYLSMYIFQTSCLWVQVNRMSSHCSALRPNNQPARGLGRRGGRVILKRKPDHTQTLLSEWGCSHCTFNWMLLNIKLCWPWLIWPHHESPAWTETAATCTYRFKSMQRNSLWLEFVTVLFIHVATECCILKTKNIWKGIQYDIRTWL